MVQDALYCLGEYLQCHRSLAVLEYIHGLLVREPLQRPTVDAEYLVAPLEAPVLRCRALLEHSLHEDRHIPVGGTEPTDDRETEVVLPSATQG